MDFHIGEKEYSQKGPNIALIKTENMPSLWHMNIDLFPDINL